MEKKRGTLLIANMFKKKEQKYYKLYMWKSDPYLS